MAIPSVTYTFTNSTVADATEVNTNFNNIISSLTDGTSDHSISTLTLAGALTANGNVTLGNASGDTMTVNATPTFNAAVTIGGVDFTVDTDTLFVDASEDRVGVGTTTPAQTLEVVGRATIGTDNTGGVDIYGDGLSRGNIVFQDSAQFRIGNNANNAAYVVDADGSLSMYDPGGVLAIATDGSGKVAIGHTSPQVALDVEAPGPAAYLWRGGASTFGAVSIAHVSANSGQDFIQFQYGAATGVNSGTNSGGIERSGTSTTPTFFTGSDRRIKENIVDMPNTLDKICQIELKSFDYKDTDASAHGPIAQDLYLIFPEKVKAFGDGLGDEVPEGERPWTVNRDWDWEIIKAIQELKAENDALKARLDALESI